MVRLVLVPEPLQDLDGFRLGWRVHHNDLEAAFESAVFLDELTVLVERRCADALHLATRERRLQDVGRVDRAFRAACTDERVQLVDEEDHVLHAADLGHDGLDALLELAAVLGPSDHHGQVEDHDPPVAQDLGHVPIDHVLGEAFDDRGLTDARLTEEDGIVFRAAAEDLNDALDLVVTADHRVELPFAGELGEVAAESVERGRSSSGPISAGSMKRRNGVLRLCLRAEQIQHLAADVFELEVQVEEHLRGDAIILADQPSRMCSVPM
jgi:hypothetical protein